MQWKWSTLIPLIIVIGAGIGLLLGPVALILEGDSFGIYVLLFLIFLSSFIIYGVRVYNRLPTIAPTPDLHPELWGKKMWASVGVAALTCLAAINIFYDQANYQGSGGFFAAAFGVPALGAAGFLIGLLVTKIIFRKVQTLLNLKNRFLVVFLSLSFINIAWWLLT